MFAHFDSHNYLAATEDAWKEAKISHYYKTAIIQTISKFEDNLTTQKNLFLMLVMLTVTAS